MIGTAERIHLFDPLQWKWMQTLILGNRDDIEEMPPGNANVLTTVLKLVDKYDLYGSVAFPKHHKQADVPEIYRLTAKTQVCCMLYSVVPACLRFNISFRRKTLVIPCRVYSSILLLLSLSALH